MHPLFLHYPITLCHSFFYIIFIFILLYTLRFVPYTKIGGALLAGIAVMGELGRDRYAPAVFVEHHHDPRPHVYFKGSVDSPQDLASRAFDAGLNAGEHGVGMGHGR